MAFSTAQSDKLKQCRKYWQKTHMKGKWRGCWMGTNNCCVGRRNCPNIWYFIWTRNLRNIAFRCMELHNKHRQLKGYSLSALIAGHMLMASASALYSLYRILRPFRVGIYGPSMVGKTTLDQYLTVQEILTLYLST